MKQEVTLPIKQESTEENRGKGRWWREGVGERRKGREMGVTEEGMVKEEGGVNDERVGKWG